MKPKFFILPVSMVLCCASVTHAATAIKAGTGTDLTLADRWSGGTGSGFPTPSLKFMDDPRESAVSILFLAPEPCGETYREFMDGARA